MILSEEEAQQALDSAVELLTSGQFELAHFSVDTVAREIVSDVPGQKKFKDTGVRVISVIGLVDPLPDNYGAEVSEDVTHALSTEDRLSHYELFVSDLATELGNIVTENQEPIGIERAKELLQESWKLFNEL